MTRRRGEEASESNRGIGEDERQPMMARLAARYRRSNLVILVTLKAIFIPSIFIVRQNGWFLDTRFCYCLVRGQIDSDASSRAVLAIEDFFLWLVSLSRTSSTCKSIHGISFICSMIQSIIRMSSRGEKAKP